MSLWIEQQGLCWICAEPMKRFGSDVDPLAATKDHLLPRSRGGKDARHNYLLAHRVCNEDRGNPIPEVPVPELRAAALTRLRATPHWVEGYQDHGEYRGDPDARRAAELTVLRFLSRPINATKPPAAAAQVKRLKRRGDIVKSAYRPGEAERAIADIFGPQRGIKEDEI